MYTPSWAHTRHRPRSALLFLPEWAYLQPGGPLLRGGVLPREGQQGLAQPVQDVVRPARHLIVFFSLGRRSCLCLPKQITRLDQLDRTTMSNVKVKVEVQKAAAVACTLEFGKQRITGEGGGGGRENAGVYVGVF